MNKQERKLKGKFKQIKRMANYGINLIEHPNFSYSLKTTGKPCSCSMCSRSKELPYRMKASDMRKQQQYA